MKFVSTLAGFFILLMFVLKFSATAEVLPVSAPTGKRMNTGGPLGFIENKGQFVDQNGYARPDLQYLILRKGLKLQLLQNSISFEVYTLQEDEAAFDEAKGLPYYDKLDPEDRPDPRYKYVSSRIDVEFIGSNPNPEIIAGERFPDYLNYYLAFTPVEGITEVRHYNKITYKNLYPNIDLVLTAMPDANPTASISYDFVVNPGGNINDIKYRYHGDYEQQLNASGFLETLTSQGKIQELIPESYLQTKEGFKVMPVNVAFDINKCVIGFKADHYDNKLPLVIDPLLIWSTYCGGAISEEGRGLTTDSSNNVAIIGRTNSTNNIATAGAYQEEHAGNGDIIIEKYDSLGVRIWGTYYGGSMDDHGRGLVADAFDNYYLGCHTSSPDGCATPGAYRENYSGGIGDDALLAYFSKDGFRIFATYYGGTDEETIRRLSIDHAGNVIMCGYTFSDTGIATPGVFQPEWAGEADLCLSKWTPEGSLIWGTYLGGDAEDHGRSVTVDNYDNIYINGSTASDGIGTPGVSRPEHAGKQDYLLGKLTPDAQLVWISYWGGAIEDRGRGVFVDSSSKYVYFVGYSASDTGVATPGAYQETWFEGYDGGGEPFHDMVLMKWTVDGQIVWSTYLGGKFDDRGRSITMIGDNEIYISGSTESPDSISTPDGFQKVWGGKGDMFFEIWDSNGMRKYGSYFGGVGDEDNLALAVDDPHHNIYLIGTANSIDLGTPGTAQPVFGGFDDCMLVKIQIHIAATTPIAAFTYSNISCQLAEVLFTNNTAEADSYSWDFGDGSTSTETNPIHDYATGGNYTVTLIATNSLSGESDTVINVITASDTGPVATITTNDPTTFCSGDSVTLIGTEGLGYTYQWKKGFFLITGASNQTYTTGDGGNYKVIIADSLGCTDTSALFSITENPTPEAAILEGPLASFCEGGSVVLNANTDTVTLQWLNSGNVIAGATSLTYTVSSTGDYSLIETNPFNCSDTSDITVVSENPNPVVSLGSDTVICDTASVILDAGGGFSSYLWSTGASTQSITVSSAGDYWVEVNDTNSCFATDTMNVEVVICTGIETFDTKYDVRIFPNPTSGTFNLSISNPERNIITVELEDVIGQTVMKIAEGESGQEFTRVIHAEALPPALYYLKISMGRKTETRKLIIE